MKPMFTGVSMMFRSNRTARNLLFSFSIVLVLAKTASAQMAGFNVNADVDFVLLTATYKTVGDTNGCPAASVGKFSFKALLTNKPSGPGMPGVAVHVVTLTNGNVLLDPQTNTVLGAEGAVMQVPKVGQYADGLLSPGESVEVPFVLCLKAFQPFQFFVDVFGIVTEALGVNVTGTSHGSAGAARLNGDGRFVAFQGGSNDLVPNDTNPGADVFVRDLQTQTTTLVSVNRAGTGSGNGPSGGLGTIAISADGRFVAFQSSASDLVANDTNGTDDVFVRDLQTGTTTLVSVNKTGTSSGNGRSGLDGTIAISADGSFIAFSSSASDLVANDTNGAPDVFVRDLKSGTTILVSVNKTGTASGNGPSPGFSLGTPIVITPDGRFVAFNSSASDLVARDTNGTPDVFVRDLQTQTTTLVSVNFAGTDSGSGGQIEGSFGASITPNGRFVAFTSTANDLVARDTNNSDDVFVRDLLMQTTTLVSVNRAGIDSGSEGSTGGPITPDGRFVLFSSFADDLVATDTNGVKDVFVRDLQTQTTTLVSINLAGTDSGSGGPPRSYFVSGSSGDSISSDGRFVSFTSFADDLVPVDTNGESDVFVRDLLTKTTTLASINWEGTDSVFADTGMLLQSAGGGTLSSDGHFVVFGSAANLVNTSGGGDLYIRPVR